MAQIKEMTIPTVPFPAAGTLPVSLLSELRGPSLDEQEWQETSTYMNAAQTSSKTMEDMGGYAENALYLFFEQRRRTRLWVIGCSVAAAGFGFFMGFYTGKKPNKGR